MPAIHMDYCFTQESLGEENGVVLVGRDRQTKVSFAHVVLSRDGDC